jgi:hypothetical protein
VILPLTIPACKPEFDSPNNIADAMLGFESGRGLLAAKLVSVHRNQATDKSDQGTGWIMSV